LICKGKNRYPFQDAEEFIRTGAHFQPGQPGTGEAQADQGANKPEDEELSDQSPIHGLYLRFFR